MVDPTKRRKFLQSTAGIVALGALAGCNGGDGDDSTDTETDGGAEDTDTETETETETETPTPTPTPQTEEVLVGPEAQNAFEPDSLEVPAGTAVTFVWESSGHSLIVDSQPDSAEWEGVTETQDSGFEHSHTFEVPGTYEYYCEPHQAFGMEGSITVTDG